MLACPLIACVCTHTCMYCLTDAGADRLPYEHIGPAPLQRQPLVVGVGQRCAAATKDSEHIPTNARRTLGLRVLAEGQMNLILRIVFIPHLCIVGLFRVYVSSSTLYSMREVTYIEICSYTGALLAELLSQLPPT